MTHRITAFAAAILIAAGAPAPAFACDPDDLKAEYRSLCATPTDAILALVEAAAPRLSPERGSSLIAKAREAKALCEGDKYDDGMRLAIRVARALGAIEQEQGLPQERLTAAPQAAVLAAR